MTRASAVLGVALLASVTFARAPERVRWEDAAAHVGRVVSVEGAVAAARVSGGACVLEFAPDDPAALRVVLMLGLLSSSGDPARRYAGRRIVASGRVQRFRGRPEMILRRADQIEVLDAPEAAAVDVEPPPSVSPAPAPPPSVSPAAPRAPTAPVAAPAPATAAAGSDCADAGAHRVAAARTLAAAAEDLARCLRARTAACRPERAAAGRALEALEAHERAEAAACR